jgi:calcineurin-like phosphoesterase family protein
MTDFVTGCTHFGHANIISLAGRPFRSVGEMDATLIANWNARVQPQDTVYHLGDFAMSGPPAETYLAQLNGRIEFIQGNHDPKGWGRDYRRIKCNGVRVVLFHYPIEEWDSWFGKSVHLHCHTHKREFISAERRGNVGVDACDFAPLRLDKAVERLMTTRTQETN